MLGGIVVVPPVILVGRFLSVICIIRLRCPWVPVRSPHSDSLGGQGMGMRGGIEGSPRASKPQLQKEPDSMDGYQ